MSKCDPFLSKLLKFVPFYGDCLVALSKLAMRCRAKVRAFLENVGENIWNLFALLCDEELSPLKVCSE